MKDEEGFEVNGYLVEDRVIIREDFEKAQEYYSRSSFGEIQGNKEKTIELSLVEALYISIYILIAISTYDAIRGAFLSGSRPPMHNS